MGAPNARVLQMIRGPGGAAIDGSSAHHLPARALSAPIRACDVVSDVPRHGPLRALPAIAGRQSPLAPGRSIRRRRRPVKGFGFVGSGRLPSTNAVRRLLQPKPSASTTTAPSDPRVSQEGSRPAARSRAAAAATPSLPASRRATVSATTTAGRGFTGQVQAACAARIAQPDPLVHLLSQDRRSIGRRLRCRLARSHRGPLSPPDREEGRCPLHPRCSPSMGRSRRRCEPKLSSTLRPGRTSPPGRGPVLHSLLPGCGQHLRI